jgi:hypothetical protein
MWLESAQRAVRGLIEYTRIFNGSFLDWGFSKGIPDPRRKTVRLVDGEMW